MYTFKTPVLVLHTCMLGTPSPHGVGHLPPSWPRQPRFCSPIPSSACVVRRLPQTESHRALGVWSPGSGAVVIRPARLLAGCSLCRRVAFHAARGPVFTRLLKAFWLFPGFSIRNGAGTRERAQAVCGVPRGAAPAHRKACVLSKLPDSFKPGTTDVGHHIGRRWCATVF